MSNIQTVTYPNLGWDTAADLYLPPGFDDKKKYPAIVSTHPIGSCKEQTAGNIYAKGLAEEGFVVLVHDASFQGASGGPAVVWLPDRTAPAGGRIEIVGVYVGAGNYDRPLEHTGGTVQIVRKLPDLSGLLDRAPGFKD